MRVEKLTKKQKHIRPNMDYLIDFNGTYQYFTKKGIIELQSKLNKLFIYGVGSSFCPCGKVTNTKDCHCPDTNFTDDDLH